ncbi:acylphosphatase [Quadrisphaera sp. DSM 44207]|uniref:acylphosphatase n=1 Tax=Quadrisphaera sp. DSM 44207 TaxID=1881057 RepID=UPI00088FB872|nr:acylphosphatase [Quadrisphaera sp. DSM 44207]SDQ75664.1 acylphosphatase [Quadrisphaera sp. DSM 44207]
MTGGGPERLLATVSGRVQGVGFRFWTARRARELGLTGWAANLPDGRVEVVAQGPRERLEELLAALREGTGGRPGRVDGVEVARGAPDPDAEAGFATR